MSCGSCKIFGGEKIKFPIDINLKVVIGSENSVETTKEQLVVIFNELKIPFNDWSVRPSSKGKYKSITVFTKLESEEIMDELYKKIKSIPGVLMAM
jgi:putative lipoic acid-binding regulatory protein